MDSLLRIIQTCHGISYHLNRHIFILDFESVLTLAWSLISSPSCIAVHIKDLCTRTCFLEHLQFKCTWDLLSCNSRHSESKPLTLAVIHGRWQGWHRCNVAQWCCKNSHFWIEKHVYHGNINYIRIYTVHILLIFLVGKHESTWPPESTSCDVITSRNRIDKVEYAFLHSDSKWLKRDQNMENEKKHDDGGMDHPELYTSFIYYLVLWSPACAMVCLILYLLSFIQRFNILYRKRQDYFMDPKPPQDVDVLVLR